MRNPPKNPDYRRRPWIGDGKYFLTSVPSVTGIFAVLSKVEFLHTVDRYAPNRRAQTQQFVV